MSLPNWATSPNACYCDPIAVVSDCLLSMCNDYLIAFTILHASLLVWISYEAYNSREMFKIANYLSFCQYKRRKNNTNTSRLFLISVLWFLSFVRTIRYSLLLGKVGSNDPTAAYFVNVLLLLSTIIILTAFSVIVYLWATIYATFSFTGRRKANFNRERKLLLVYNALLWTTLIIFHMLHYTLKNEFFGALFNIMTGVFLVLVAGGMLIWGLKVYRILINTRSYTLASASDIQTRDGNRAALRKLSSWIIGTCIISVGYVLTMVIFRGVSIMNLDTTFSLILRHSIYRSFEICGVSLMVVTFRKTSSDNFRSRAKTQTQSQSLPMPLPESGTGEGENDEGTPTTVKIDNKQ